MKSRTGDWVEVRSKDEILATLDKSGRLDGLPFMPEMFAFCGRRMRVHRRAHKGCDTIQPVRSRGLSNGVMLEGMRCDGRAHGDCEAACTVMWKEAWLKPVDAPATPLEVVGAECTEADVKAATRAPDTPDGKPAYRCQATDYPEYTTQLRTRNLSQFLEDLESRNVDVVEMLLTVPYFLYDFLAKPERPKGGAPFRWLYDRFAALTGLTPYPRRQGALEDGWKAPSVALDLKPGELVRVKSYEDILATLGKDNTNRGLMFDGEMVPYCGGVFRVRSRVDQFLDERTGVMRRMKTPAVILDNVWCRSRFSNRRLFCPRAIYSWWREAWLERAPDATAPSVEHALGAGAILRDLVREEEHL